MDMDFDPPELKRNLLPLREAEAIIEKQVNDFLSAGGVITRLERGVTGDSFMKKRSWDGDKRGQR